jgi:hypothetical protein
MKHVTNIPFPVFPIITDQSIVFNNHNGSGLFSYQTSEFS